MRVRVLAVLALLVLSFAGSAQQRTTAAPPDAVFYNGKVITVDAKFSIQQAFGVSGDRVTAVGSTAGMRALAGPATRLIDLRGAAVIPGLTDNHDHVYDSAKILMRGVGMNGVTSTADALVKIREAVAKAKPGDVVYTSTLRLAPGQPGPTIQDLDQISTLVAIVVPRGRRGNAQLNTAALARAGITKDTPTFAGSPVPKDANGNLTGGTLRYPAGMVLLDKVIPPMSDQEEEDLLAKAQAGRNALGLTSVRDLSVFPAGMRAYFRLWKEGRLTVRTSVALDLPDPDRVEEALAGWGVGSGFGDAWLRLDTISEDPYPAAPAQQGGAIVDGRTFTAIALAANRYGWRLAPHIGDDEGQNMALDAYEAADRVGSIRDKRWVIEHAPFATPQQMDRMARLGVLVSASLGGYNANIPPTASPEERTRLERQTPMREFLDHKLIVSGGTDFLGGSGSLDNPFLPYYFYVTRKTRAGQVIGPHEKISREEALRVMTVNYAYTTFDEKLKGSIQPGMLADFLVLSGDILTVPDEQLLSLRPLATYVGGRKVFASDGGGF
jgi:predicted amidohydrolase YtcJ